MMKWFYKWAYYKVCNMQVDLKKSSKRWKDMEAWKDKVMPHIEDELRSDLILKGGDYE